MKKHKRHNPEQIITKLCDADEMLSAGMSISSAGMSISEVCQSLDVGEATYQRWQNQYGAMKALENKRLKELEVENRRLKKLLAEAELEKAILKEALE